jgi:hypothetical protein
VSKTINVNARIINSITKGLDFLKGKQSVIGAFSDFSSTGRPSIEWITAHVCWVLEEIEEFELSARLGVNYLISRMNNEGSWGFNGLLSGDCDTTAQVMLVLKHHGITIKVKTIDWILKQQNENGGYPTYPFSRTLPFNNWSMPHSETTLAVIAALKGLKIAAESRGQALKWLYREAEMGPLKAFWWKNPSYILWVQKKTGIDTHGASKLSSTIILKKRNLRTPHYSFLLYKAKLGSRAMTLKAHHALIDLQLKDGSWPCQPCMRVTKRICHNTVTEQGLLYSGDERVFSTAHAVAVLYDLNRTSSSHKLVKGLTAGG